jgi:hypothetical protein
MDVRKKLDEIKESWGLETDLELANKLETAKHNIDSWVKREKIPKIWELKIGQMLISETKTAPSVPANTLNNHIADREMEIIKAFRELSAEKQEVYYYKIKLEAAEERIKNQEQPSTAAKYA